MIRFFCTVLDFLRIPHFVNIDCSDCKAVEHLILSPIYGVAIIKTNSGNVYSYPCSRFDMLRMKKFNSVGEWINECCIG